MADQGNNECRTGICKVDEDKFLVDGRSCSQTFIANCSCQYPEHQKRIIIEKDPNFEGIWIKFFVNTYFHSDDRVTSYNDPWYTRYKIWWSKIKIIWKIMWDDDIKYEAEFLINDEVQMKDYVNTLSDSIDNIRSMNEDRNTRMQLLEQQWQKEWDDKMKEKFFEEKRKDSQPNV